MYMRERNREKEHFRKNPWAEENSETQTKGIEY